MKGADEEGVVAREAMLGKRTWPRSKVGRVEWCRLAVHVRVQ